MATNTDGHLVDDKGNVVVDFVWGNLPLQPNDNRDNLLDFTKDNHVIVETGWNGYPLYTPNTVGTVDAGVAYVTVPNVLRLSVSDAQDSLADQELGTVTVASAFTPVISAITLASNVVSVTASAHGYKIGDVVTIAGLTNGSGSASADADLNGTYTITAVSDANNFAFAKTHTDITTHSGLSGNTAKVAALAGKVYSQSIAPNAADIAIGTAITITPYFAS